MAGFNLDNGVYNSEKNETIFTINHTLNNEALNTEVIEIESGTTVRTQVRIIDSNSVEIGFNKEIPDGKYRIILT